MLKKLFLKVLFLLWVGNYLSHKVRCSFISCTKLSCGQMLLAQSSTFSTFSFINGMTRAMRFFWRIREWSNWIGRHYRTGSSSDRLNKKCSSQILLFEHLVPSWWISFVWFFWCILAGGNISCAVGSTIKSLVLTLFLLTTF